MNMPRHFSRKRSKGKVLAWLLLVPVVFATGFLLQGWVVLDLQRQIDQQSMYSTDYIFRLQQQEAELARLRRSSQIDIEAVRLAQLTISDLQQQMADQDQQLQFYQAVLSPEARKSGIRLVDLDLEAGIQADRFQYRLLMIQQKRNDQLIRGSLKLVVSGHKDGKPASLNLSQLGADSNSRKFRFRYFSELTGDLVIPPGFQPTSVMVTGRVTRPKRSEFQKKYDWPKLEQGQVAQKIDQLEAEQDVP